ncbi:breast carcinoma-amplified sequence 1 isoform X4 [Centroberyx affinis]|uniref:breast carcinoma-amplified sequence 1 isoform X4 n=1 Tax=Centroberyx affinis TaxID=166261 RepID=UPI003A5B9952
MGNEHSKNKEITKNGKNLEKHENGVNGHSVNITSNGLEIDVTSETAVQQNGKPVSLNSYIDSIEPDFVIVESDCQNDEDQVISESPDSTTEKEEVKETKEEKVKVNLFGKIFKTKTESPTSEESVQENESSNEDQMDVSPPATDPQPETADIKQDSESFKEPDSVTLDPSPEEGKTEETYKENNQPVESQEDSHTEENPVMNFFKTLVTPTKTPKKETATPDATKDQSQKETQPAATTTTTVAQVSDPPAAPKGMSIPPPPPPEPPKMEIKGEPAAKAVKPTPKEEPKAAAKEPEASKGKSAKDTLSNLFRSKKVDASKTSTLEAAAKPEPPPPVQEEKKPSSKTSFLSFFKPKAAEPKKETPAPPAAAEAVQTVKAKEEPKAAAKSAEAPVDNKSVSGASQSGDDAANVPRKLEKRNSIHLFFKNLGQKRHSTDAGVQTEPVTVAPAAEKAK